MKRLDLVVGPNGAGKTTFIRHTLHPIVSDSVFVNADLIAAERWPDDPAGHSYEAAEVAARTRDTLVTLGRSFIAETVASHPSKLDLIRRAQAGGYVVVLHVVLVPPDLSVARVRHRVAAGGHDVPEDKVRERHARLGPLYAQAIGLADEAYVYDNSRIQGPLLVAWFSRGDAIGPTTWPEWAPDELRAL